MIFNILDNTTELWMTKYIIGEIFSSGRATLYKDPSDQTVQSLKIATFETDSIQCAKKTASNSIDVKTPF